MDDPESDGIEPSAAGPAESAHDARVFLSYRRDDAPDAADRLYSSLAKRFGERNVFIDVDTIDIGAPFAKVVDDWIARSDVLLALIGRRWINAVDPDGNRRLADPKDYVRREIEAALELEIRVVPVLIHGATLPDQHELPASLTPLLERQAVEVTRAYWELDVERLGNAIDRIALLPPGAAGGALAEQGEAAGEARLARDTETARAAGRPRAEVFPRTDPKADGPPAGWRSRRGRVALVAVAAGVVAAGIAFALSSILGNGSKGAAVAAATGLVGSSGGNRIAIGLPAGWQQIGATTDAGLPISYPLAVSAANGGGELILGTASDVGPTLLPTSLSSRLGASVTPQRIELGKKQLYRFNNVTLPGASAPQTLYALPTTSGVVLAACVTPPTAISRAQAVCEQILESADLSTGSFLAPDPSIKFAAALSAALTRLAGEVRQSGTRSATNPGRQAAAAGRLALAYAAARSAVAAAKPGPADAPLQRKLTDDLANAERAYATLAAAARRQDGGQYARAGREATSAVAAFNATLAELKTLGYDTSS
jgi:hypothetical protein